MNPQALARATKTLIGHGIVAYPTEYCYGLGCDPMDRNAVQRILQMKKRSWTEGLIVIVADFRQLAGLIDISRSDILRQPLLSWPGPHTWLMPALPRTPKWLCGDNDTIAVRIPGHPIARALCRKIHSPIVSTSANRSGRPPLRTFHQISAEFGDEVDFILKGFTGNATQPSSIRDVMSGKWIRGH